MESLNIATNERSSSIWDINLGTRGVGEEDGSGGGVMGGVEWMILRTIDTLGTGLGFREINKVRWSRGSET